MSRFISRDPFARNEIHRNTVKTGKDCSFCGLRRKDGRLFQYFVEHDSVMGRRNTINGLFCSIECMRSYQGLG